MICEMYKIEEHAIKYPKVCENCYSLGYVDSKCSQCGGKGVINKSKKIWEVCKYKEKISYITGDVKYWTAYSDYYSSRSKIVHFSQEDAERECSIRNGDINIQKDIFPEDLYCRRIWTRSNGEHIKISDMNEGHIKNTINLIIRDGNCLEWIPLFIEELNDRGIESKLVLVNDI